jgi:hypothetical protein
MDQNESYGSKVVVYGRYLTETRGVARKCAVVL